MARQATEKTEKPAKKTRSGGSKRKLSTFNKFMREEMARLKAEEPDISHRERFKLATENWKMAKDSPEGAART